MTDLQNQVAASNAQLEEIGRKAVQLWNSSERDGQRGDAMATFALFQAYHVCTFKAETRDKNGHLIRELSFDLHDYATTQCKNEDGSRDNKMTLARTLAVLDKVFGLPADKVTNAHKTRLARCVTRAIYLAGLGYDETNVKLSKQGFLQVPYPVMHDEPNAETATEREMRDWKNNQGDFETLDGKEGMSLAALDRKAKPKQSRDQTEGDKDAARSIEFVQSVKFLNSVLAGLNDEGGNNPGADNVPSPSEGLRKLMWELHANLSTYFDADPFDNEGEEENKKDAA